MYYTPQSIAVHDLMERQNFRRGGCAAYDNPVLYDAPDFIMPPIMIKRLTTGDPVTVTLVDLTDTDVTTLTPTSAADKVLDAVGEFEMHVLGAGDWPGVLSLMDGGQYYLRIEDGLLTYYTDEFVLKYTNAGFPEECGHSWVKMSWVLNGTCIVSGKTSTDEAEPVHAYPSEDYTHRIYWNANLSRPEWEYDEKGEEDAHGVLDIDTKKLVKRWKLEGVPVSESVADAITTAALSDAVTIAFPDGTAFDNVRDIRTEISWESGGCLATVSMSFSTDYFVKQGCC